MFAIPQEPTINQRFGILMHQVLERFHAEEMRAASGGEQPLVGDAGGLDRLLSLFEAGWRRQGFGATDDELQYRDRAVAALTRYVERNERSDSQPVWLERNFAFAIGPHQLRGRVDRVDRRPDGGYELIDYKTGDPGSGPRLSGDVQLALYRLGRPRGVADRRRGRQLLVRARRRAGAARGRARRRRAGRAHRARGRRAGSRSRTSSPARRTRSAPGATTG